MAELAFCGLDCNECPVFQATRADDQAQKVWLAMEYSAPSDCFHPSDMTCLGCHQQSHPLSKMCRACEIRRCASQHVLNTCAECYEFPCVLIERFVPVETDNRNKLDEVNANQFLF